MGEHREDPSLGGLDPQFLAKLSSMGDMAAGIAHNLNQPLNNLTVMLHSTVRALDKKYGDKDPVLKADVQAMLLEMKRMHEIVEHVRNISVHQIHDPVTPVDLSVLGRKALGLIEGLLQADQVQVTQQWSDQVLMVSVNTALLEQAIYALVHNAWLAARSQEIGKRRIELGTRSTAAGAELWVTDSGPGIAADLQSRIFEPFFTMRAVGEGMGLGLSSAHAIVRSFGGQIDLASAPDGGATFCLRLPVC